MNPHPKGIPLGFTFEGRENHFFAAPTIGTIRTAVFLQPLTIQTRTVEIVRYAGADTWKARILETRSVFTRPNGDKLTAGRSQAEFASATAGAAEITRYFQGLGMRLIHEWQETRPAARPLLTNAERQTAMRMIQ
jgi:hypothetical protein